MKSCLTPEENKPTCGECRHHHIHTHDGGYDGESCDAPEEAKRDGGCGFENKYGHRWCPNCKSFCHDAYPMNHVCLNKKVKAKEVNIFTKAKRCPEYKYIGKEVEKKLHPYN